MAMVFVARYVRIYPNLKNKVQKYLNCITLKCAYRSFFLSHQKKTQLGWCQPSINHCNHYNSASYHFLREGCAVCLWGDHNFLGRLRGGTFFSLVQSWGPELKGHRHLVWMLTLNLARLGLQVIAPPFEAMKKMVHPQPTQENFGHPHKQTVPPSS